MIVARISAEPLDVEALVNEMRRLDAGAVVTFEGTVRSPNKGKVVQYLDYEAYDRVVTDQLHAIATEVVEQHGLLGALIVHRVGRVGPNETAVVAVTVAAHRGAAFDGTEALIDRTKAEAAIWKHEVTEDGSYWPDASL